jgi:hypothetical protein
MATPSMMFTTWMKYPCTLTCQQREQSTAKGLKMWSLKTRETIRPAAHSKDSVKDAIKGKTNVNLAVVPGGYTSLLQPLDVGIIKPFKDGYRRRWHHWMLSNAFSNINKLKRPDYLKVCQWVSESWQDLRRKAVIPNSFRTAFQH